MRILIQLLFIFCTSKGITAGVPDIVIDGIERCRVTSIKLISDHVLITYKKDCTRNIVLSPFMLSYGTGLLALYAKDKCVSDKLINTFNFTSKEQLKATFPYITLQIFSFGNTTAVWTGTVYTGMSRVYKKEFLYTSFKIFNTNLFTTDFGNCDLAVNSINQAVYVHSLGLSENLNIVTCDMVADDGRIIAVVTGYFEGSLGNYINPCETTYKDFYLPSGKTTQLRTMRVRGQHKYALNTKLNAEILEIYFDDDKFYLRIVKPKSFNDIPNILIKLRDAKYYDEVFSSLNKCEVDIDMPYIDYHQTYDAKAYLEQALGGLNVSSIEFKNVYEGVDDARVTQFQFDLHVAVNGGRNYGSYRPTECGCTKDKPQQPQRVQINNSFLFYIGSKTIPMYGGVYAGNS